MIPFVISLEARLNLADTEDLIRILPSYSFSSDNARLYFSFLNRYSLYLIHASSISVSLPTRQEYLAPLPLLSSNLIDGYVNSFSERIALLKS
jgi:hypothetical protein